MRALSLSQPYASLVAAGHKKIETRSWRTSYRGPLAIHAAKSEDDASTEVLCIWMAERGMRPGFDWENMPFGAVLAVAELWDCFPTVEEMRPPLPEFVFGDYTEGRWGWRLKDVRVLKEPVPCRGSLGVWTPSEELRREIERRLVT